MFQQVLVRANKMQAKAKNKYARIKQNKYDMQAGRQMFQPTVHRQATK